MVFVAAVLGCLGVLIIAGFVVMAAKIGALGDELRDVRKQDVVQLGGQLAEVSAKLHGLRLDVDAQRQSTAELASEMRGPPSLRRPRLHDS